MKANQKDKAMSDKKETLKWDDLFRFGEMRWMREFKYKSFNIFKYIFILICMQNLILENINY